MRPAKTMIKQIAVALVGLFTVTGSLLAQSTSGESKIEAAPAESTVAAPAPTPLPGTYVRGGGPSTPVLEEEPPATGEFWGGGDYLVGWIRGSHLPPLVTTSLAGTPIGSAGVLGLPTTTVVLGNQDVNTDARSGGRFQLGYHGTGQGPVMGIEAGFWFLQEQNDAFLASSNGSTILARPFIDAITKVPVATRIAFPGISSGFIAVNAPSQGFTSLNLDMSKQIIGTEILSVEGLAGYRFFNFGDDVQVLSQLTTLGGGFLPGTKITALDQFSARNTFNGGEMGFRGKFSFNRFTLDVLTKLAVGEMHQTYTTFGASTTAVPGVPPVTSAGGLLALGTNNGTTTNNDDWVLATEVGLNLGYRLNSNIVLRAGYTFLWWDGVARAADQIDLRVNQNQIPPATGNVTPPRPAVLLQNSELTVQALNFGVEFHY